MTERPTLTLEQKASLVAGASMWSSVGIDGIVPALTLSDGPHGLRRQGPSGDHLGIGASLPAVCFPPAVGIGATWNAGLAERVGAALGRESRALGVNVLLGPGLNIKRSPLGGRNFEYLSEDPRIAGTLAAAMVRGIQSMDVAATPKHFAVNNQETDRMRVSATVSDRALREIYLAGFEQVVREANPWAIMTAYNRINGTYASEHHWLLTEVLRGEWGFDGLAMSDWGAVDSPAGAVAAGLDLEMPPSGRAQTIVDAVTNGELDEAVLDVAIERLTQLADRTVGQPEIDRAIDDSQAIALQAAREAITLLENDGVLPLSAEDATRMLVVGEFARSPRFQGGGSSRVAPTRTVSALDALRELTGADVAFEPGFALEDGDETALEDAAVAAAADADVVVAFLGLPERAESEGFDRTTLSLPAAQLALLARLKETEASVVVVLSHGGVVEVSSWRDGVAAILDGWLLGQEGGRAIAEVLLGVTNPSGRLPETIPHRIEDTPSYLTFPGRDGEVLYGEDIYVGYRSYDTHGTDVAYPLGYGLSYTSFSYDALDVVATETGWTAHVTVRNVGERAGAEVVQLYIAPVGGEVTRPAHELRGFSKVALEPGESATVALPITLRDLSYWNAREDRWQVEAGQYRVEIGASSRDIRLTAAIESDGDGIIDPLHLDSTLAEWSSHPLGAEVIARMRAGLPADLTAGAPELEAMARSTPVMKLVTWGVGITEEVVRGIVSESEAAAESEAEAEAATSGGRG